MVERTTSRRPQGVLGGRGRQPLGEKSHWSDVDFLDPIKVQQLKSECRAERKIKSLHSFSGFVGGKPWLALQRNQSPLLTQRLATILPNSLNGFFGRPS